MQGIHSVNKQQLNQTHINDKDACISQKSNKQPVLKFTHNGQATPENTHSPALNLSIKKLNKLTIKPKQTK